MATLHQANGRVQPAAPLSYRPELVLLRIFLAGHGYHQSAQAAIAAHAAEEGTLEGAPGLEPEDVEGAETVFVDGMEPVPQCAHEWGSPSGCESERNPLDDVWNPADVIRTAGPIAAAEALDRPDAPDWHITQRPGYWEALAVDGITPLPAISGGSGDEPYQPTDQDWAEYREMFDRIDAMDFPRACNADDRRAFAADIAAFYQANPEA